MAFLYSDPFKDSAYGKLKGDKSNDYFTLTFDEAKIYPLDNGYIFAAFVSSYSGILRSFKPEMGIEPGLCEIPFYSDEYELRYKVNGEYTSSKYQPSKFEKALCQRIKDNEANLVGDGKYVTGKISHLPNGMCANYTEDTIKPLVDQNVQLTPIPTATKLKEYTPPSEKRNNYSKSNYSRGASLEDKLAFVKKELVDSIISDAVTTEDSLGRLTEQMKTEHAHDETFLTIYFDMLMALAR